MVMLQYHSTLFSNLQAKLNKLAQIEGLVLYTILFRLTLGSENAGLAVPS